jgi:hypothetical protein
VLQIWVRGRALRDGVSAGSKRPEGRRTVRGRALRDGVGCEAPNIIVRYLPRLFIMICGGFGRFGSQELFWQKYAGVLCETALSDTAISQKIAAICEKERLSDSQVVAKNYAETAVNNA